MTQKISREFTKVQRWILDTLPTSHQSLRKVLFRVQSGTSQDIDGDNQEGNEYHSQRGAVPNLDARINRSHRRSSQTLQRYSSGHFDEFSTNCQRYYSCVLAHSIHLISDEHFVRCQVSFRVFCLLVFRAFFWSLRKEVRLWI